MQWRHRQPLRRSFANAQTQWNLKDLEAVIIEADVPEDCLADTGCRTVNHDNVWDLRPPVHQRKRFSPSIQLLSSTESRNRCPVKGSARSKSFCCSVQ